MRAISISEIGEALKYGENQGYLLFPEIKNSKWKHKMLTHPITQKMVQDILELANKIKNEESPKLSFKLFIEYLETGNRNHYETVFFASKKELHSLVMAEIMKDDGCYIEAIEERLWQWCDMYTWELPAHVPLTKEAIKESGVGAEQVIALFAAESGFYFAEILDLIGDKLHELLVYRLEQELSKRIIKPYEENDYWWEESNMNWASVCSGAIGCTAIYQIKDSTELAQIIARVIKTMQSYFQGFDKDGVTTEGLSYWQYGFSFFMYFSQLLKERTCGKLDLFMLDDQIRKIAKLPIYLQFPNMQMINFSDTAGDIWYGEYGLLAKLQQLYGINEYQFSPQIQTFHEHTSKWALLSRNIFWTLGQDNFTSNKGYIGTEYFEESQWFISRSYNEQNKFVCFAAKGGNNQEPHNHNDLGHFIVHFDNHTLFCDLGAPEYTKNYFQAGRYEYLHASSKGHSVPIINECCQKEGKSARAIVTKAQRSNPAIIEMELTEAYQIESLKKFIRKYTWNSETLQLNIEDTFHFNKEVNSIEEVFMTHYPVELQKEKVIIHTPVCDVNLTCSKIYEAEINLLEYSNHFAEKCSVNQIKFKIKTVEKNQIILIHIQIV